MGRDPLIAVRDVLREIDVLHGIGQRMTLEAFKADPIASHAAAYAVQIISEAVRHIPDDWLAEYPTEPWAQIKGIGNRLRHEYFRLDDAILWDIVTMHSHALKAVMKALLERHGEPPQKPE
jgi:uncharacterized protein with HEPN domain